MALRGAIKGGGCIITAVLQEQRREEKDAIIDLFDRQESDAYAKKWDQARLSTSDANATHRSRKVRS